MPIFPGGVLPVFLSGTPGGGGQIAAQLQFFDVKYDIPPVVGFSVSAEPTECED